LNGDAAAARDAYDAFLNRWRDADSTLKILRDARAERGRLH
jgi:hypothetical protein